MDFGQILHTAKKNEKVNQNGVRYYSTKFEPPKKEEKKSAQLSENIKKFLAKKEAEEKRKAEEERKRKNELLALRSQDRKATRRVNVMLKRTKSANQSVLDDAVDNDNTAVTLVGPMQPDEDDYGYVSQEASAFYNKMMEKYSKMPDEPKFNLEKKKVSTNLGSTKDRVKAALDREKEEAMMPRKRKRKHKDRHGDDDEEGVSYGAPCRDNHSERDVDSSQPKQKPKPRPAPPPMNFAELLKIAEKKQHEPIVIEKKEKEEEKLFTKKQRKEAEREREYLRRKEERMREAERGSQNKVDGSVPSNKIPKLGDRSSSNDLSISNPGKQNPDDKISKLCGSKPSMGRGSLESSDKSTKDSRPGYSSIDKNSTRILKKSSEVTKNGDKLTNKANDNTSFKIPVDAAKIRKYLPGDIRAKSHQHPEESRPKQYPPAVSKNKQNLPTPTKQKQPPSSNMKPKQFPPPDVKPKQFPPPDVKPNRHTADIKPKHFPPSDMRAKQFPPRDPKPKQFPPPDVRRKDGAPVSKKKSLAPSSKRRILDDDDSEYDSEMDDFIDDDEPEDDYSKYIKDIFGYDRNRYREDEDDIDNMESSFAQQMREEVISTKIGIMEDLEDIKKEEEEKRRKALMKKKRIL